LTASDLAALEQVIEGKPGVPAGTRFPANVLQLADTERQAQTSAVGLRSNIIAARQRQGARLTHVISTINLAGWTSDLNQSTNASDLLDPIGEVAAIVKALTKAIDESVNGRLSLDHEGVISAYDLVAAAPNWIAGST
jgi:hypothetical protein